MTPLEKMARAAIDVANGKYGLIDDAGAGFAPTEVWIDIVSAALQAIRDPDKEMMKALRDNPDIMWFDSDYSSAFTAMIDNILERG